MSFYDMGYEGEGLIAVERVGISLPPPPPWCMFDPNPMPRLVLFPRLSRWLRWVR